VAMTSVFREVWEIRGTCRADLSGQIGSFF
jgi:hypothetical protein